MVALINILSEQSRATYKTQQAIHKLMDYCATNPNAIVRFHACDMRIKIHSDVRYINAAGARSQQVAISTLGTTTTTLTYQMGPYLNLMESSDTLLLQQPKPNWDPSLTSQKKGKLFETP